MGKKVIDLNVGFCSAPTPLFTLIFKQFKTSQD
jgi:hypothetical protein